MKNTSDMDSTSTKTSKLCSEKTNNVTRKQAKDLKRNLT